MLTILRNTGRFSSTCLCAVCKAAYDVNDRYAAAKALAGNQCPTCKLLPTNAPTQALLHQIYNYDPATGSLTYKRDFSRRCAGEDATTSSSNGYRMVSLDKSYLAHRMIWLMQTGNLPETIDHINHTRTDNRWHNLRDATTQANAQNKSVNKNNTTGYMGVSFMPAKGKFRATLTRDRKQVHLGLFATAEEAWQARLAANEEHGFHENHGKAA